MGLTPHPSHDLHIKAMGLFKKTQKTTSSESEPQIDALIKDGMKSKISPSQSLE